MFLKYSVFDLDTFEDPWKIFEFLSILNEFFDENFNHKKLKWFRVYIFKN